MNRYLLNQAITTIETDGRRVYVTLVGDVPDALSVHPLVESVEGRTVTITGIRDKGKHRLAWDVLLETGVIR